VRPSSGAATGEAAKPQILHRTAELLELAAPEDGRASIGIEDRA